MNVRAVGCLVLGSATFVIVGLVGMSLAFNQLDGCPESLQWDERRYLPAGSPLASPALSEPGDPEEIGSTFIGLTTRRVFGPPGSAPSTSAADRPDEIALDCDDGTFQAYRYVGDVQPASPTATDP